jgi:hypothetical protein
MLVVDGGHIVGLINEQMLSAASFRHSVAGPVGAGAPGPPPAAPPAPPPTPTPVG